jgi:hypothetical protein
MMWVEIRILMSFLKMFLLSLLLTLIYVFTLTNKLFSHGN